eukprot:COSAG01_NODE_4018_length_5397_cov_4.400488_3_plen_47_part_00
MYVLLDSLQEHTLLPLTLYAPPPLPRPAPAHAQPPRHDVTPLVCPH